MTEEQDTTQVPAPSDATDGVPVSREALYEMVWSEPMLRVAARFGVSSSYMAHVCTLLNVPRPERGYWAKLAVGKAPKQPPLPEPRPGDRLEWTRDGALPKRARSLPRPPERGPRQKRTARRQLPDRHPEARDHRVVIAPNFEQFHRADVDERENPRKGNYHSDLWSPMRCTVVYIGTVAIDLTIIEMSEEAEARYVNGEYVRLTRSSSRNPVLSYWSIIKNSEIYFPVTGNDWINSKARACSGCGSVSCSNAGVSG